MAEFSKQWCEKNEPNMPGDFDILEIHNQLEPNSYAHYICEGYGFLAIAKIENGDCALAMPVEGEPHGTVIWKRYEDVIPG
jgi:hypothetical protein